MPIDAAFVDEAGKTIVLVLVVAEPWDSEGKRLEALQERLGEYATFVVSGQLRRQFAAAEDCGVAISVEYADVPGDQERSFFERAYEQLADMGIGLRVALLN